MNKPRDPGGMQSILHIPPLFHWMRQSTVHSEALRYCCAEGLLGNSSRIFFVAAVRTFVSVINCWITRRSDCRHSFWDYRCLTAGDVIY